MGKLAHEVGLDIRKEPEQVFGTDLGFDFVVGLLCPAKCNFPLLLGPTPFEPFRHRWEEEEYNDPKADSDHACISESVANARIIGKCLDLILSYLQ